MNSEEITSQEAASLETAYTNKPYSSGSASFTLSAGNTTSLLGNSSATTIGVFWGRNNNGILKGVVCAVANTGGSLISGTSFYVDGQSISSTDAATLMSDYAQNRDANTPDSQGVYFERSHVQTILTTAAPNTVIALVEFTFARESDETLNVVATNDQGTVYFNRAKTNPK
jgi:hypothetical protein